MINTHTLIQGITGGGKTHLTLYLIQKWAFMKRWDTGWVLAVMPKAVRFPQLSLRCGLPLTHCLVLQTYLNNEIYKGLLDEKQVVFDEYPKQARQNLITRIEKTVEDNRRQIPFLRTGTREETHQV